MVTTLGGGSLPRQSSKELPKLQRFSYLMTQTSRHTKLTCFLETMLNREGFWLFLVDLSVHQAPSTTQPMEFLLLLSFYECTV